MIKPDQPERDSLFHRILKVLNEMPDSLRQTFMLSHYNGLSLDQIARKIGVAQQDAPPLLRRANTLFYEKLELSIPPEGPHAKVRNLLKIAQQPISLETPTGEREDSPLRDTISVNLKEQTAAALQSLTPREEQVIRMRFGIGYGSECTVEEVGQRFSVTRECIGRVEDEALRKLRHPSRIDP